VRLLSEILLSPITGPIRAVDFVTHRVKDQVESEYLNEGKVQAELLDLTLRYDRGEISDDEYQQQEAVILEHLNDIRAYRQAEHREQSAAANEG
jgi:Gas vesicle protein G